MVYAFIMAGGQGTRMGNTEKPKQFLEICGKPILLWSVEAFRRNPRVDAVLVLTPREWIPYTRELLEAATPDNSCPRNTDSSLCPLHLVAGGPTRTDTLLNGIRFLKAQGLLDEGTCLLTHDAVRPLVTDQIIDANIDCVLAGGTCTTAVPATDTLLHTTGSVGDASATSAASASSGTPLLIDHIPDRSQYYLAQTPQSFRAQRFLEIWETLTETERAVLTDASKVFVLKGEPVTIVPGHPSNLKITYAGDLAVAETWMAL
ncbi:2-C-methyl-D-erythritol 4-phosphate cytidylyltransferase [Eubacterium sp. AB3007]|uniref:IspD/TarI family cytidylyltransferase n=1 Tax=Eubacterium sp. AB3007 TaxID=1392487 RepID=UPI000486B49E|nr:2-C-methyl-D-erythritol 4-phosphate cytidylyltransferase [Eubacterium sp. AB3007]